MFYTDICDEKRYRLMIFLYSNFIASFENWCFFKKNFDNHFTYDYFHNMSYDLPGCIEHNRQHSLASVPLDSFLKSSRMNLRVLEMVTGLRLTESDICPDLNRSLLIERKAPKPPSAPKIPNSWHVKDSELGALGRYINFFYCPDVVSDDRYSYRQVLHSLCFKNK